MTLVGPTCEGHSLAMDHVALNAHFLVQVPVTYFEISYWDVYGPVPVESLPCHVTFDTDIINRNNKTQQPFYFATIISPVLPFTQNTIIKKKCCRMR